MPFKGFAILLAISCPLVVMSELNSLGRTGVASPLCGRLSLLALFHPDYTVGSGISPDLLTFRLSPEALAGSGINPDTAGGELHPALRTLYK